MYLQWCVNRHHTLVGYIFFPPDKDTYIVVCIVGLYSNGIHIECCPFWRRNLDPTVSGHEPIRYLSALFHFVSATIVKPPQVNVQIIAHCARGCIA